MAGPWESYQAPATTESSDAASGPWSAYAKHEQTGPEQAAADEAITSKERGMIPDELKAAGYSAGDMALFGGPTYAAALHTSYKENIPFKEALNKQREYEAALSRQNPVSSAVGTGVGLVGGLAVPLGPLGKAGNLAAKGAEALGAGRFLKSAASGATVGAEMGAISGAANKYGTDEFTPAEIAKSALYGGAGGALIGPAAEKIIGKTVSPADAELQKVLESQGIKPSQEMITGKRAPEGSARGTADEMREQAKNILEQKQQGLVDQSVGPNAGGEALGQAAIASRDAAQQPFKTLKTVQGNFDFGNAGVSGHVLSSVQNSVQNAGVSSTFRDSKFYPGANAAFDALNMELQNLESKGGQVTFQDMIKAKDEISKARGFARDIDDSKAVEAIIKGYKQSLNQAVSNGMFQGTPQAQLQAAVELGRADKGWSDFIKTYQQKGGGEKGAINQTLKQLQDANSKYMSSNITPEMAQAAQGKINQYVTDPRLGPLYYSRMEKMIGAGSPEMESFNAAIRNNMLTPTGDNIAKLPDQFNKYLDPRTLPVTLRAFGADTTGVLNNLEAHASDSAATAAAKDKLRDLRNMGQAIDTVYKRPVSNDEKAGMISTILKKYALPAAGFAFNVPHGTEAVLGALAGKGLNAGASGISSAFEAAAQRAGAPRTVGSEGSGFNVPYLNVRSYPRISNLGALEPVDEKPGYTPVARASGGRVGGMTADQLLSAVERAKKKTSTNTKPLLGLHDNQVAKALEIANHKI